MSQIKQTFPFWRCKKNKNNRVLVPFCVGGGTEPPLKTKTWGSQTKPSICQWKPPKKVIALNEFLWRTLENHPKLKPIQHPEFKMMDRKIETQISGSQTVLQILKHPRNLLVQSVSWKIQDSAHNPPFFMILLVGKLCFFNFGSLEHSKMLDFFVRKVKRGTYNTPLEASVACVFLGGNLDVLRTGGGTFDIWQHVFFLVGGKNCTPNGRFQFRLFFVSVKNSVKIAICSGFFDVSGWLGSFGLGWCPGCHETLTGLFLAEGWSLKHRHVAAVVFDICDYLNRSHCLLSNEQAKSCQKPGIVLGNWMCWIDRFQKNPQDLPYKCSNKMVKHWISSLFFTTIWDHISTFQGPQWPGCCWTPGPGHLFRTGSGYVWTTVPGDSRVGRFSKH